ncbi:hypothetical protein MNBD_ALPHA03-2146 [hydrothermal vent metagenome]|uniref:Integrase catalytic domain-containing protein n=2 Tax=hydrothermal vent metagenome TaxID=652676 RepID=A0A3B1B4P2_9ZZZZ
MADNIGALRYDLDKSLDKYNSYRPHNALEGETPLAYIEKALSGKTQESQNT